MLEMRAAELRSLTEQLLSHEVESGAYASSLARVFSSIDPALDFDEIFTPAGTAISSFDAGLCVQDAARTAKFTRGIHAAMRDLWQTRPKLRILYIGTGPYATLLMPLLVMGGTSALERVDLVEVNPSSARMLQTCLDLLELDQRRIHLYAADFMSWETPHRYDLIICEVMAAALVREPQMAVVKKARGLLSPGGVLIPERISLFWGLSNQNREPRWPSGMSRVPPARYQWTHLGDLSAAETPPTTVELEVKRAHCEGQELTLFTEVQVYGEEVLQDAESMIVNTVCVFSDFRAYPCRLRLHYVEGPRPGWTAEPIRSGEGNCLRGK